MLLVAVRLLNRILFTLFMNIFTDSAVMLQGLSMTVDLELDVSSDTSSSWSSVIKNRYSEAPFNWTPSVLNSLYNEFLYN